MGWFLRALQGGGRTDFSQDGDQALGVSRQPVPQPSARCQGEDSDLPWVTGWGGSMRLESASQNRKKIIRN